MFYIFILCLHWFISMRFITVLFHSFGSVWSELAGQSEATALEDTKVDQRRPLATLPVAAAYRGVGSAVARVNLPRLKLGTNWPSTRSLQIKAKFRWCWTFEFGQLPIPASPATGHHEARPIHADRHQSLGLGPVHSTTEQPVDHEKQEHIKQRTRLSANKEEWVSSFLGRWEGEEVAIKKRPRTRHCRPTQMKHGAICFHMERAECH